MAAIVLTIGGVEVYRRDVTALSDRTRARLLERIDTCLMTGAELSEWGKTRQAVADARLTPAQQAERIRIAALSRDERAAEFAMRRKLAAEAELAALPADAVETAVATVTPVEPVRVR